MRLVAMLCCVLAVSTLPVLPALAARAAGDPIQLTIHDGRVSLVAQDVTVRQILAEWARIGQTQIVNGERVPGGRITLQLSNMPEQEALDLLLRAAAGYIAARRSPATVDGSRFDRILILPTTAAPAPSVSARAAAPAPIYPEPPSPSQAAAPQVFLPPGVQRVIGPDGQPVQDDQDGAPNGGQRYVPLPPGFAEPPPEPSPSAFTDGSKPTTTPTASGVPVPGMIVSAPQQRGRPVEVQPTGPAPQ